MRVPAKVGGVTFNLTGGRRVEGIEVTPDEFQADTIPYTFRLEEALAATNLPAWPSLNTQLFSSVTLRYSNTGSIGTRSMQLLLWIRWLERMVLFGKKR